MGALDLLQKNLQRLNQTALSDTRLGDTTRLEEELPRLRTWVGGGSGLDALNEDRIVAALRAFHQSLKFDSLEQARLVCYGCTQSFGLKQRYRLIEDRQRFMKLLNEVDKYRDRCRPFRKCYRGLLNGYFSYDPDSNGATADGQRSWEDLRKFLDDCRNSVETLGFNPEWVTALSDHRNLLTNNPCQPYGLAALQGDRSAFDDIRNRLEISDDSWLIRRLVFAQIGAAIDEEDPKFKGYLEHLIQLLSEHRLHANDGLAKVLDRYAKCPEQELHLGLRDFSVGLWGNPWLQSNRIHWQHCSSEARELVTRWLKRYLLREFFSILSEDGAANTRRLDFWELYCEDPPGMFFALGSAALDDRNRLFKKFVNDAKGLCKKLNGGQSDLHAFIMQFGRFHVIEFSLQGNSTYFYDTEHGTPPYELKNGWLDVGSPSKGGAGLKAGGKNPPFSIPRRHVDTNSGLWEQQFAEVMGATPGSIREFCRKYECEHVMPRRSGGNEWIMPTARTRWDEPQWAVLWGWGFLWSDQKKGFYRAGA